MAKVSRVRPVVAVVMFLGVLGASPGQAATIPTLQQSAPAETSVAPGAVDPPGGFTARQSGDWTYYERPEVDLSATGASKWRVATFKGEPTDDGGCRTMFSATLPANSRPVEGFEIAFNAATCESRVASRELDEAEAASRVDEHDAEAQLLGLEPLKPVQGKATHTGPGSVGPAATGPALVAATKSAYTKSWYEDPPGLDVSYTEVRTTWTYSGGCVTSATGSYRAERKWQTGWWTVAGPSWNNVYNCAKSSSNLYAVFANELFCPGTGNLTFNTYDRTRVEGKPDASVYWAWPSTKSGGCSSLLSHRYQIG